MGGKDGPSIGSDTRVRREGYRAVVSATRGASRLLCQNGNSDGREIVNESSLKVESVPLSANQDVWTRSISPSLGQKATTSG